MAPRLVAAAACSHAPPLVRTDRDASAAWSRLNDAYDALAKQFVDKAPEVLIVIYDDHFDNFFLNAMPTFAIGAASSYQVADEGFGGFWGTPIVGEREVALAIAEGLVGRGFDLTVCHGDMQVDHGVTIPLPRLSQATNTRVIPIVVNTVWPPYPSPARCWDLGVALREVLDSIEADFSYGILASGGLSHQLAGEDFGVIRTDFDLKFMSRLEAGHRMELRTMTIAEILQAGDGALEVLNWITMVGALGPEWEANRLAYEPISSAVTGMGVFSFENASLDDTRVQG